MPRIIRVGTRESQLAVWQADLVKHQLQSFGFESELVYIRSDGDMDLTTPLYEMGAQGIFTRSLDIALLQNRIDIAVHSMKDVPVVLAQGLVQAAVLKRASYKDILVYKSLPQQREGFGSEAGDSIPAVFTIATSSIRRKAQWLHRYSGHQVENLRGNVNTRLRKVEESHWNGAIFAAAGLERIQLRPINSIDLDWMLPAPAQGAIMVVCRTEDVFCKEACAGLNDPQTALCTGIERNFLKHLLGGCSAPIGAIAEIVDQVNINFRGNILSVDGTEKAEVTLQIPLCSAAEAGRMAALRLLENGGQPIQDGFRGRTV